MDKKIPFVKYSSYGNNFVIVDELETPFFTEHEKIRFANAATDICFGVGSDNFLVIQRCTRDVLETINQAHNYWPATLDIQDADYIFRMFEPDGTEAYSCGNGLMCIARYLYRTYELESIKIVTEIPTEKPKVINIGTETLDKTSWANLGKPRPIPKGMFQPEVLDHYDDVIVSVKDLEITFRNHDLEPFSKNAILHLTGYIVFTGEPHLVIFPQKGGLLDGFDQVLFASSSYNDASGKVVERRVDFGIWLVEQIGKNLNTKHSTLFPAGMNVNFARVVSDNDAIMLEYRCFERGINRETLACGTGAVAVAYIARHLGLIQSQKNMVLPYRCRLHRPDAIIQVEENKAGCVLHGYPSPLFGGEFEFNES